MQKKETTAGVHQREKWTPAQENAVWHLFIEGRSWVVIETFLGKSIKACRRKIEKIYGMEQDGSSWIKHRHVQMAIDREQSQWTANETHVLLTHQLPLSRIARLLGRSEKVLQEKHNQLTHAGAIGFQL